MSEQQHHIETSPLSSGGGIEGGGCLSSLCSIYAHAKDTYGEYFDPDTGELIRQMSIRDFLLTDRWKPQVMALHDMIAQQGVAAKKTEEYQRIKRSLPGATLSGIFGTHRRTAECISRTGYIALDIDYGDNTGITDFSEVFDALTQRDEVEVVMHSCSGMGYLALVRIAYPDMLKEHFNALAFEYKKMHINLDRSCSDITRLRFATWDPHAFVRPPEDVIPYSSMLVDRDYTIVPRIEKRLEQYEQRIYSSTELLQQAETLVSKCEARHIDLTSGYQEWCNIGWSLKEFGEAGRVLFHRLSALNPEYTASATDRKWRDLGNSATITFSYLKKRCKEQDVWIWR